MELVLITLAILVLAGSSWIDIKTREVPDMFSYGLLFAALGIRGIYSFEVGINILYIGLIGFAVCFIISQFLYHTRQWGGGDSKLLMAMGAVIGLPYPFVGESLSLPIFFVLLLFVGAGFSIIWMAGLASKKWGHFKLRLGQAIKEKKVLHIISLIVAAGLIAFSGYSLMFPLLALSLLAIFYLLIFVAIVEEELFLKTYKIKELTPGDWLAREVFHKKKVLMRPRTLEKKDIALLVKNRIRNVIIKEGVPFVPSFLISYLILIVGKDWFLGLF